MIQDTSISGYLMLFVYVLVSFWTCQQHTPGLRKLWVPLFAHFFGIRLVGILQNPTGGLLFHFLLQAVQPLSSWLAAGLSNCKWKGFRNENVLKLAGCIRIFLFDKYRKSIDWSSLGTAWHGHTAQNFGWTIFLRSSCQYWLQCKVNEPAFRGLPMFMMSWKHHGSI